MMLSLIWHDDSSLHLILNKKYMGWTCGLCGDYDGDQSNDLFYKESLLQPIEFGTLHKFRKPEQDCVDPKPEPKDQCIIFRLLCLKLLRNSKWKLCNRLVDPDPYIEAYMHDMCSCNSSVKYSSFCLCSTIAEYSRQCAVVGGKPPDWRSPEMCYVACPYNLIYKECSSPCAPTCSNPGRQFFCDGTCVSGCVCPTGNFKHSTICCTLPESCLNFFVTGLVLDDITNSGCVPLKSCSCIFNNDVYLPGSYYHAPCFSCLCSGGHWTCQDLPCPSSCSVEGGSHITTFDKARYTFHGKCIYILAKSCADNAFLVTIEMQKCAYAETATCLKRVFLFLDKGKAVTGVQIFWPSSFYLIVHTKKGLYLQVQLTPIMQLYVILDPSYKTKTCGLCGNFNDVQKDDFRSSSGAVEANVVDFANTWKTQYSCKNVKPVLEHPCSYGMEIEKYAHFWCNILINKEGPFADCHTAVNPDPYRQNCLFDTCSCRRTEDCMCAAVSSYVWACAAVGIKMAGWREEVCKNYVSYCPPSLVYSYTVASCIPTCRSLTEPDLACSIKFFTIDGCVCPKGTYLNENGMCVVKEDCPCYYKGIPITFDNPLHVGRLICTCTNGQINCTEQEIPVCPPPFIYFDCEKVGEHSKGSECPNTCHTSNAQCYSPLCVSGCMCPKGLVLNDDGTCIYDSECPCFHNGVSYKTGDKMIFRCNNCVCNNRTWVCDNKADMGVCTVYGEGHYITFDSKRYTINGDCEYTLVQDFCDIHNLKKGTFKVITENVPCGTTGTSCSKTIIIYLGGHKLILSDGSWEVVQTSSEIDTAYKVRNMGLFLVVETTNGLVIKWDKMTSIFIYLSISFKGKVCGLCGNFDGNRNNDFTTRSKCVVEDATEFRDSWKVSPSCPEVYISKDPCSINPHRVSWAQKRCTVINSNVFAKSLFCDFYNKQRKCEWSYKPCGAPCMKTCRNPSGTCLHHLKGLEGCYPKCPENKPFFNEDEMQCVAQCGCLDNDDNYYKLGAKVESCNICESCMCTEKGILCYYDKNACYCEFQGNILEIGETIQIEDDLHRCITVKCGVNGTTTYPCYSTTTGITENKFSTSAGFSKMVAVSKGTTTFTYTNKISTVETSHPGHSSFVTIIIGSSFIPAPLAKAPILFLTTSSGPYTISAGFSKATTGPSKLPTSEVSSKSSVLSSKVHTTTKTETTGHFILKTTLVKLSTVPTPSKSSVLSSKGPLTAEEISKVSTTSAGPSEMATSAFRAVTKTAKPTINTSLAKTSSAQNATSGIPSMKSTMSKKSSGFTTKSTRLPTVETNPTKSSSFPISSSETALSPEVPFEVTTSPTELTKKANESLSTTKTNALQTAKDFGQYTSILTITSGKPDDIQKPYFSKCVNVTCYENGQLNVESVKCPLLKDVTCNDGKPPMKVYDQDGCCFYYECRTCMGFNGKIRKLGETWQEHCQECTCDKETAKIICMLTECPQLDNSKCSKPWLEPFLLLTENDRCCGSIECRCSPSKCNTTLGDCPLGYEHVNISSDDCCIIYECRPLDVCMVEGAVYQVGNPVWTSASSCLECKCTDRKDLESGFNIVDCNPILCMMNCPQGFFYQKSDNTCCGRCEQVSCPVKDEYGTIYLIQPGETQVLPNDNCTHYTCENIDGLLITSSQKQICSELNEEECEPNSIMKEQNGCCNVCRVAKACSVQTKQTLVSYNGCSANVTLSYCTGVCPSFQEFSVDKLSMDRTCGCCQELEAEEQNINLTCADGESNISFNITNVRRCGCTSTECTPLNQNP
ncbi:hypothetical protein XELAEV_18022075mg [Xenopus laevis]|uniref:Uncharacterized protein n=1 Tax=Xenopus laevis TaxID=8355 RepID=A0A974D4A8_XENLA|nr:hypothetical protein XELAEV_18022075mg [Xenopus laevis]